MFVTECEPTPDTTRVDFVQGLALSAPGVARAQEPLVTALAAYPKYRVSLLRFPLPNERLWFPYLYTAMPALLLLRNSPLVHIGNAWYAHLVPLLRTPSIVTCHDLIELDEMERGVRHLRPHRALHTRAWLRGMQRARFIVCVSQWTADRVMRRIPHVADRVRVVRSGVSSVFNTGPADPLTLHRLSISSPYILYVGSEQSRKNVPRMVAAIAEVRRTVPDLTFVKVGASQTAEGRVELLDALQRGGMGDRTIFVEAVSDDELCTLYRAAAVTVLVSRDEGFGFPPLEAMRCGCPTVVSNDGALREISGGAALMVDPGSTRDIARGIERVVSDAGTRADLVTRGLAWSSRFTWDGAARAYATLYDEAVSPR